MADQSVGKLIRLVRHAVQATRASLANRVGQIYEGARDIWKILGYPTILDFDAYFGMYGRQDVAGRIVDMPAQETWRFAPTIVPKLSKNPSDDPPEEDEFFNQFEEFAERLNLWSKCEEVDRLSGIGRYGVLFIGVASGGKDLKKEVTNVTIEDIIYLRAYHEGSVDVETWDEDIESPRFGMPVLYKITLAELSSVSGTGGGSKTNNRTESVHWTRIIHVADNSMGEQIFGRPRLERVFNRLIDLLKISGGSAEMFWQNVAQIYHANIDPEYEFEDSDLEDLEEKFEQMLHGIRRLIQTEGVDIKTLGGDTPDPRGVFKVLAQLIASGAEIPQRILFGSESGEQASTQDQAEWYGRINSRQERFAEPVIIKQIINRLALWGTFTVPSWEVLWQPLFQETGVEKATRARSLAMAAQKFDKDNPNRVIAVSEIRVAAGLPAIHPNPKEIEEKEDRILLSKKVEEPIIPPVPPNPGIV